MKQLIRKCLLRFLSWFCHDKGPKVIFYHDVGRGYSRTGTDLEVIKSHVAAARQMGYEFVSSVEDLSGQKILMCFDDGFRGIWEVRDYFIAEKIFPMIFIAIDLVGQSGYLTWDEILALKKDGFSFQSHTWTHRSLTEVSSAELAHEILDSKTELSKRLNCTVEYLCFPRGMFSRHILCECARAGYSGLFTSIPFGWGKTFPVERGCGEMPLYPRILVQSATAGEFKSVLSGAMSCLARRYFSRQYVRGDDM